MQAMLQAWGPELFCQSMFWILTKIPTGVPGVELSRTVPFSFNRVQRHLFSRLVRNNRVLKARQAGLTTFFLLVRLLMNVITEGGKTGLLISQNNKYAEKHFQIARRAYRLIGAQDPADHTANTLCYSLKENLLHTSYSSRREIIFDQLDSKIMIESAEVEEAGQGVTVHHGVASEVARWPGDPEATVSNVKGSLVPGGTWDEESTADGAAGYFYEQCLRSMDNEVTADARFHYYSWWWSDEYSMSLAKKEQDELLADLTSDELNLISAIHKFMSDVSWIRSKVA